MKYENIVIGQIVNVSGKRWEIFSKDKHWVMLKSPEGKLKKVSLGQLRIPKTMENYRKVSNV